MIATLITIRLFCGGHCPSIPGTTQVANARAAALNRKRITMAAILSWQSSLSNDRQMGSP